MLLWKLMMPLALVQFSADADRAPKASPEMRPIEFLAGTWQGRGWVQTREGRAEFTIRESIVPKLDGNVFLVEGKGKDAAGKVHHHALAFFHYDKEVGHFRVKAFRRDGGYVDAKGEMKDGAFVWGFAPPQGGNVRFTLKLNDKKQWIETGEFSQDGENWFKILEMTLDRVEN